MFFSSLILDKNKNICVQIEEHIRKQIELGLISPGSKLPSTREVAKKLEISRNSVMTSYEELESQGIIETIKGKGTFISRDFIKDNNLEDNEYKVDWESMINDYGRICRDSDIMKSEKTDERIDISFKSIAPEDKLFDMDEFKRSFQNVCAREGTKILNYGYARGYKPLIDYFKSYMSKKGVSVEGKEILITNGFTEAFDMILSSITREGDCVITESPTHNTAIKIMKAHKLDIVGVPILKDGLDLDILVEKILLKKPRFIYLVPSYHNPTGVVTSGEKRRKIYDICRENNIPIIEDGFNEELMYSGSHIPPIMSFASNKSGMIYIGSLSKILFPGLRLGWIMADKEIIDYLESVKRARNIHCSTLDQAVLCDYLSSGTFDKYVKKVRKFYKDKYKLILQEIENKIPYDEIMGEGGLHVFVRIKGIKSSELLDLCRKSHVSFMCGDIFFPNDDKDEEEYIRLGFARLSDDEIKQGIDIISRCINKIKNKC